MMKSEGVDIFDERSRRREPPWVYELEGICANAPTSFLGLAQCAGKGPGETSGTGEKVVSRF
jgi:hypothetical protein